jgi:catechol 2,3-dioxygenase-like lactoylglutathione lyase family enzyme
MQPRIHTITLAVEDLKRALDFYRGGLGLPSDGIVGTEFHDEKSGVAGAIAMFHLPGGLVLSLYPRSYLAKDAGVPSGPPSLGSSARATSWAAGTRWTSW